MAKQARIEQIAELKSRSLVAEHRLRVALSHLQDLATSVDELQKIDLSRTTSFEIYRGIPVMITATIESYIRAMIAALIDSGDPYRTRAQGLKEIKIDIPMFLSMENNRVTLGELVAHSLSLNNPSDIKKAFDLVSDEDLWRSLAREYDTAIGMNYFFPATEEELRSYFYQSLAELYKVRHIVCHEPRHHAEVSAWNAAGFCGMTIEFLLVLDHLADTMLGVK
jgi:hypothetical protein